MLQAMQNGVLFVKPESLHHTAYAALSLVSRDRKYLGARSNSRDPLKKKLSDPSRVNDCSLVWKGGRGLHGFASRSEAKEKSHLRLAVTRQDGQIARRIPQLLEILLACIQIFL